MALRTDRAACLQPGSSRPVERQADLADGNRGCRLWRPIRGINLSGYVPLSRQLGRSGQLVSRWSWHNTLAASDYGLLDERTFDPRRITGERCYGTLMEGSYSTPRVGSVGACICMLIALQERAARVCACGHTSRDASHALTLPTASERYTLHAIAPAKLDRAG